MVELEIIISIATTVLAVLSLQGKRMAFILICQLIANALIVVQYSISGAFSGAWICSLAVVQLLVIYLFNRAKRPFPIYLTVAFILGYAVITAINFTAAYDVLSGLAACTFALSVVQRSAAVCRVYMLVNSLLWLAFGIFSASYGAIPVYAVLIIVGIVSMIRLDRDFWRGVFARKSEEK